MTSMKTVLLGSAAAILATGAAQAADLPVKKAAAAVQYVEVCPAFGRGFYRLPGGDICIRHFGTVKFGLGFMGERTFGNTDGDTIGVLDEVSNITGWQWTVRPGWDFRSPTPYGTLRTVVQLRADMRAGLYESQTPSLTGSQRVTLVHRGYIEWAGFVIGRAGTNFAFWDQDDVVSAIGGDAKATTNMQITYVFSAPGGITATLGLEDTSTWQVGYLDVSAPGAIDATGPMRWWDMVASIATEQSWGSAKLAGLVHTYQTNNGTVTEVDYAYAVLAGITFKLPSLGAGDQLLLQGIYCDGVIAACGVQGGASNSATSFERSGQYLDGLQRTDFDAYLVTDGGTGWNFEKTKAWAIAAQLRHYWAPLWRSNLSASYLKIEPPAIANTLDLSAGGRGDLSVWDVGFNLIWGKSRQTAEIGVEVIYKAVTQDLPAGDDGVLPAGVDQNPSGWTANAFIQRSW